MWTQASSLNTIVKYTVTWENLLKEFLVKKFISTWNQDSLEEAIRQKYGYIQFNTSTWFCELSCITYFTKWYNFSNRLYNTQEELLKEIKRVMINLWFKEKWESKEILNIVSGDIDFNSKENNFDSFWTEVKKTWVEVKRELVEKAKEIFWDLYIKVRKSENTYRVELKLPYSRDIIFKWKNWDWSFWQDTKEQIDKYEDFWKKWDLFKSKAHKINSEFWKWHEDWDYWFVPHEYLFYELND